MKYMDGYTLGYMSGRHVFQYYVDVCEITVHVYVYIRAHIKLAKFLTI